LIHPGSSQPFSWYSFAIPAHKERAFITISVTLKSRSAPLARQYSPKMS
jgi:hypothetical protein